MKGTITQFVRGGDGSATITVKLQAEHPAEASAEAIAKSNADFEESMSARDAAFKEGNAEVSLDIAAAKPARSERATKPESTPKPDRMG